MKRFKAGVGAWYGSDGVTVWGCYVNIKYVVAYYNHQRKGSVVMAATATNPGVAANESGRFRLWMAAAFFTIYFVWGTTYLAIRYAVETIPPIVTAGLRHTTAGLILLALAWSHGFRPRREHWIAGAVLGALFFLIGHGTLHWAEQHVSSGFAALLVASEPLWILLIGAGMRQQRINWLNGLGLLIGMAFTARVGFLITFGSVVAFSAYTWLLQHCSPTIVATHTFVNPLVAVLVGWLWASEPMSLRILVATVVILGSIVLIQRGDRHAKMQAEAVGSD